MTPNTIEFRSTSDNTWVMRITADRKIEVNEDVDVTFAAQKVLDAMQYLLKAQRTWVGSGDLEDSNAYQNPQAQPAQRTWVDLTDTQIEQVYFEVVQEHRGAPMPWGQVQFGRALLDKFKERL